MMDAGALPERGLALASSCPSRGAQAAPVLQELDLVVDRASRTPCGECMVRIGFVCPFSDFDEVVTSPVFVLS